MTHFPIHEIMRRDSSRLDVGSVLLVEMAPNDHTTISFGGVQQNLAVIVRAGEADVWEGGYDLTTGTLVWNRQRQMFGDGAIDVIEVGLVG